MRKLKTLWRHALSPRVWEELEAWTQVLLALGAAVLLFVTLKAQTAHAASPLMAAAARPATTMAADVRATPWHAAYVQAVLAPGMPPEQRSHRRSS